MDERDTTAVIDRTLAGDPPVTGHPDERELQRLTQALAAERPAPDVVFVAELDERVRDGFAPDSDGIRNPFARVRSALAARTFGRPPMALLGGVASMLIALVVVVALTGGQDGGDSASTSAVGGASGGATGARELARPKVDVGEPTPPRGDFSRSSSAQAERIQLDSRLATPVTPPRRGGFAPGTRDRRIQRSASLTLAAPADKLDRVAMDITKITERHRGFVLTSSLATGDEGATTGGDFELKIPAARLQPALDDLAKLGQVRARTQAGEDVTARFVTAGDRLEAARAERRSLLSRLEQADTDIEAESLRLQLDGNAGEINRLRGRLRNLRIGTDYATVGVVLEARGGDGGATTHGDGLGGALDDAVESLGDSLEIAIRVLGVLVPLGLLTAVLAVVARKLLRRRRESALS
jgi:Domain of unknown function (DUF4349)